MDGTKQKLFEALIEIKASLPKSKSAEFGICTNVGRLRSYMSYDEIDYLLKTAFASWPDVAINDQGKPELEYPVEGDAAGYTNDQLNLTLWANPRRLALLDYLIEYFGEQTTSAEKRP